MYVYFFLVVSLSVNLTVTFGLTFSVYLSAIFSNNFKSQKWHLHKRNPENYFPVLLKVTMLVY